MSTPTMAASTDGLSTIDTFNDQSIHVPVRDDDDNFSDISSMVSSGLMAQTRTYPTMGDYEVGQEKAPATPSTFASHNDDIDKIFIENGGYYHESKDDNRDWVPLWLTETKTWIKFLLLFSVSMLMGSVIFIFVALAMTKGGDDAGGSDVSANSLGDDLSLNTRGDGPQTKGIEFVYTEAPTVSPSPNADRNRIYQTTSSPTTGPTSSLTTSPTSSPTLTPTAIPSHAPTIASLPDDCKDTQGKHYFSQYQGLRCHQLTDDDCTVTYWKLNCKRTCNACGLTLSPTMDASPSPSPSPDFDTDEPTFAASNTPTESSAPSTLPPSESPTSAPTSANSESPSSHPTIRIPKTSFYVMGGYINDAEKAILESRLNSLPASNGEWLFHLGGFSDPVVDKCEESVYENFSTLFSSSSVPVYPVPGSEEWNDCPSPDLAWSNWTKYLNSYDTRHWNSPTGYEVSRQNRQPNNFRFVKNRVLYVGVEVLSGTVHMKTQWNRRHRISLDWIEKSINSAVGEANMAVIVGHGAPSDDNDDFFEKLYEGAESWGIPIKYLYETSGARRMEETIDASHNVQLLGVDGTTWPPLKLEVDTNSQAVSVRLYQDAPTLAPSRSPTTSPTAQPSGTPTASTEPTKSPSKTPSTIPTEQPSISTKNPTTMPSYSPSFKPSSKPTESHSATPSVSPSVHPTPISSHIPSSRPSYAPSAPPTSQPTEEEVFVTEPGGTVFYVTGGLFQGEQRNGLEEKLRNLPSSNGEWMVHLGDWNNFFENNCDVSAYAEFDTLFSESPVAVYCTPGDNEWNDCPNPDEAWGYWKNYLGNYDTRHWNKPSLYTVKRQGGRNENFAFVTHRVLYIGVNMVGGYVQDQDEWSSRHDSNLFWIRDRVEKHFTNIELIVIFGHAEPGDANDDFFTQLADDIAAWDKVTIYIHETQAEKRLQSNFKGVQKFLVTEVQGGVWPPARISIDTSTNRIQINQNNWHLGI